jgi:quinol monooxygenase YgiN
MIARLWLARVDHARRAEYEAFVLQKSMPMFRALPGCLSALFVSDAGRLGALTIWRDQACVDALSGSAFYRDTVRQLEESGLILAAPELDLFVTLPGCFVTGEFVDGVAELSTLT